MKITRLRLKNFGAFYGDFDFNLTPHSMEKNVVLFGGKNGSGKTTILEAIRLALYGPVAYGFKVDSSAYYEKIDTKLNSYAKKKGAPKFQILLDIELVENLERKYYVINRSWERTKSSIKEKVAIQCNDHLLKDKEIEIFQDKLREETPPQLLELFLFDGEHISQVISDNSLSTYLKESARVMFNIDLFENLEADLNNYLKTEMKVNGLSKDEQLYFQTKEENEMLITKREELTKEFASLESDLEEKRARLNDISRQFEVHGGLLKEQRDLMFGKMKEIDLSRHSMMDKTKDVISTIFPFLLLQDLLSGITKQMEKESEHETRNNIKKIIGIDDFKILLDSLLDKNLINTNQSPKLIAKEFYQVFLETCASEETSTLIHNASYQQRAEVEALYNEVVKFNPDTIVQSYKENARMIKQVQELRKKIDENDSTSELKELLDQIHELKIQIDLVQHRKNELSINLEHLDEEISIKQKEFELASSKFMNSKKAKNVVKISERVLNISKSFRELQTQKKLKQVEIETTKMLQRLFRKELFVVRVSIHPETFSLRLYNNVGEELNKDILSAGEKQILLLSTIWAMSLCSKRKLPFVFDTLLGRLDQTHKKRIIESFIPKCGEQVIILSTDSEIDDEHFKLIKPIVSKAYTIDFNSKESTVDVSDCYFSNTL